MKEKITRFVREYTRKKDAEGIITNIWKEPLVVFGDAALPDLVRLKELVHPDHLLPEDVLPGAKTIIAYFLPFREELGTTNEDEGLASVEWAKAYEKTNAFFLDMNGALIDFLKEHGVRAAVTEEAVRYDDTVLRSKWSQRHLGYFCGLGTFGVNHMLITKAGCCGRVCTVVTDLDVEHDAPVKEEYCLYKKDGSCLLCVERCPVGALTETDFDAFCCNRRCDENAAVHVGYCENPSYALASGQELLGSSCCGKCLVGVPCTHKLP